MSDIMMWLKEHKEAIGAIKDLATALALALGGVWAFQRFVIRREFASQVEFTVNVEFIGMHDDSWIVNVVANLNNKAGSRLRVSQFGFDLRALDRKDQLVQGGDDINGQTWFPTKLKEGSWLPTDWSATLVEPNTNTRYTHVAHIPRMTEFVLLHGRFYYKVGFPIRLPMYHTSDCVVPVPIAATGAPGDK